MGPRNNDWNEDDWRGEIEDEYDSELESSFIAIAIMHDQQVRIIGNADGGAAQFSSVEEVEKMQSQHVLGCFDWWAFNVEDGESFRLSGFNTARNAK
jgi:hypothetical protein